MKRLLPLLIVFAVSLVVGGTAFAEVNSIHEEKTNWKLTYPIVNVSDNCNLLTLLVEKNNIFV